MRVRLSRTPPSASPPTPSDVGGARPRKPLTDSLTEPLTHPLTHPLTEPL